MENTYNPMRKEFQDERKRLELTGYELRLKYEKEGKTLEKGVYKKSCRQYTNEQLLWYLIQFYEKYGRPPTEKDFTNNSEYPSYATYVNRFESWSNALKLVGLDAESMVKNGILLTNQQKARLGEIIIRDHFEKNPKDLAGENQNSPCDGICPNGRIYDVKAVKLHNTYYQFSTKNKFKEEIEIYYFLAFNEDWTKLKYGWRVPGEIVDSDNFLVGAVLTTRSHKFDIYNMKEYDITKKLDSVLRKYGFYEKVRTKEIKCQ